MSLCVEVTNGGNLYTNHTQDGFMELRGSNTKQEWLFRQCLQNSFSLVWHMSDTTCVHFCIRFHVNYLTFCTICPNMSDRQSGRFLQHCFLANWNKQLNKQWIFMWKWTQCGTWSILVKWRLILLFREYACAWRASRIITDSITNMYIFISHCFYAHIMTTDAIFSGWTRHQ